MKLITYLHLVLKLGMSGSITPFPNTRALREQEQQYLSLIRTEFGEYKPLLHAVDITCWSGPCEGRLASGRTFISRLVVALMDSLRLQQQ